MCCGKGTSPCPTRGILLLFMLYVCFYSCLLKHSYIRSIPKLLYNVLYNVHADQNWVLQIKNMGCELSSYVLQDGFGNRVAMTIEFRVQSLTTDVGSTPVIDTNYFGF